MCAQSVVSNSLQPHGCNHLSLLSMEFSRQEHWNGLPFPPLGHLSHPGIKPLSLASPAMTGRFFTTEPPLEARHHFYPRTQRTFKAFHMLLTASRVNLDRSSPSASGQDQCLTTKTDHIPENAPGKKYMVHSHFPWGGQRFPREGTETHTGSQHPGTSGLHSHLCHGLGHLCSS